MFQSVFNNKRFERKLRRVNSRMHAFPCFFPPFPLSFIFFTALPYRLRAAYVYIITRIRVLPCDKFVQNFGLLPGWIFKILRGSPRTPPGFFFLFSPFFFHRDGRTEDIANAIDANGRVHQVGRQSN